MSGSWSDSEYISSYSFILARGIRSICMITPEILLPVMWACRSRHRVQIDVQLQAPMMSWHCWLLFIYKWVNALIYIYTVTHTHVCKHACMHASLCYFLYPVCEGQEYMKAIGHICWTCVPHSWHGQCQSDQQERVDDFYKLWVLLLLLTTSIDTITDIVFLLSKQTSGCSFLLVIANA